MLLLLETDVASVWHDRRDWLTRLFAARKFRTLYPKNARLVALRRNTHILCEKYFFWLHPKRQNLFFSFLILFYLHLHFVLSDPFFLLAMHNNFYLFSESVFQVWRFVFFKKSQQCALYFYALH